MNKNLVPLSLMLLVGTALVPASVLAESKDYGTDPKVTVENLQGHHTSETERSVFEVTEEGVTADSVSGKQTKEEADTRSFVLVGNSGDFTVNEISGENANTSAEGGALKNQGTFTSNTSSFFKNNHAKNGGAIWSWGPLTLNGTNEFTENVADSFGGAILAVKESRLTGKNTFTRNKANAGGALQLNTGAVTEISGTSTFEHNEAATTGGAIDNDGTLKLGSDTEDINTFYSNTSGTGGGAINNSGTVELYGTTKFDNNEAVGGGGGAIWNAGDRITFNGLTDFINNRGTSAGALFNAGGKTVEFKDRANFEENQAKESWGGAIQNLGILTFTGGITEFDTNTAKTNGGAIYNGLFDDTSSITFGGEKTQFFNNTAEGNGGAIYNETKITADNEIEFENNSAVNGGGIDNTGTITFNGNAIFRENHANKPEKAAGGYGGAIYNETKGLLTFNGLENRFENNTASGYGSAIYNSGTLVMGKETGESKNTFSNNTGSAAFYNEKKADFYGDTTFSNNDGAVYNKVKGVLTFHGLHNNFENNQGEFRSGIDNRGTLVMGKETGESENKFIGNISTSQHGSAFKNTGQYDRYGSPKVQKAKADFYGTTLFENNRAEGGAGGAVYNSASDEKDAANITFTGSTTFKGNHASDDGGAIYNADSKAVITINGDTLFEGNTSDNRGGAFVNLGQITLTGTNRFLTNEGKGQGGGAIRNRGTLTLSGTNEFEGNKIHNKEDDSYFNPYLVNGGAINNGTEAKNDTGELTLTGESSSFTKNEAANDGGAIYHAGATTGFVHIESQTNTFKENKALGGNGGAIANGQTLLAEGETVGQSYPGGNFTIDGTTTFTGNTAGKSGGAVYNYHSDSNLVFTGATFFDNNTAAENGGGLYNRDGSATFNKKAVFNNNHAVSGGGVYNYGQYNTKLLFNGGIEFTGNTATENGGGLYHKSLNGSLTLKDASFTGNNAKMGGGLYVGDFSTVVLDGNTSFTGNTATENGGAIYNGSGSNLTLKGSGITISGNTAAAGSSLYNLGTVTIDGANDDFDITDSETAPATEGKHTLFDQNGTIYNNRTLNIQNSKLMLHGGINTEKKNHNGQVNITKSTVDLGGAGTDGADNTIYADEVNINDGSRIISHVNAESDKFGRISARSVNVSSNGTGLTLVLPFNEKLQDNETREYQILEADKLEGEFAGFYNSLYDVYAVGEGKYRLTSKSKSCVNGHYDEQADTCVCDEGFIDVNGSCQQKAECNEATQDYNVSTNECTCKVGYVEANGSCELKDECDPATEDYNDTINLCECKEGFVDVNGVCQPKAKCDPATQVYDPNNNTCACAEGYFKTGDSCVPKAECDSATQVYDPRTNTCACAEGYIDAGDGSCEPKDTCDEATEVPDDTGGCKCKEGFVNVGYGCEAKAECGAGQTYDESRNSCVDKPNSEQTAPEDHTNYCENCDSSQQTVANAWLQGVEMPGNKLAQDIQNELYQTYQIEGGSDSYKAALDALAPDVAPLVQAHIMEITRQMSSITSERLHTSSAVAQEQEGYRLPKKQSNLWAQGLYGKSKYSSRKGWDMDTRGIALGADGFVNDTTQLGLAYAYTTADGDSVGRDTEIDSHTVSVYGQYEPSRFYANWLALYTRSNFEEEKEVLSHIVDADYDVDALAGQAMVGYKVGPFNAGGRTAGVLKPEAGARYIWTHQRTYTDTAGQTVRAENGNTLTGVLGAEYGIGFAATPSLTWYPELRAAVTYDFVEPDTDMRVNLLNGSMYTVSPDKMDRFGIEAGARLGLDINSTVEVAAEYDGVFKGDYKNHSGLISLKYKF